MGCMFYVKTIKSLLFDFVGGVFSSHGHNIMFISLKMITDDTHSGSTFSSKIYYLLDILDTQLSITVAVKLREYFQIKSGLS